MPYTLSDLPDAVKALPQEAKEAWMKAYNAAYVQYNGDEAKANATAWAAIKQMGYIKKDDKWIKLETQNTLTCECIKCGHKVQIAEGQHCIDLVCEKCGGQMRREERPGPGQESFEVYRKDLLIAGEYPHPQDKNQKIIMDVDKLKKIADYTKKFLLAGGKVPITISHPKKDIEKNISAEEAKIALTQGYLNDVWVDETTKRLFGDLNIKDDSKSEQWIKDGKLQSVSPGIYHGVVTSAGVFPVMIDHIALTSSPHNLGQLGFMPMNAESFSSAEIFFENHCITYQSGSDTNDKTKDPIKLQVSGTQGGNIMNPLQEIMNYVQNLLKLIKALMEGKKMEDYILPGQDDGGNGGNGNVFPRQDIQAILNPAVQQAVKAGSGSVKMEADAVEVFNKLLLERDTLQKKVDEFETETKKTEEEKTKKAKDEYESRIDKLILAGRVKPENRKLLIEEYETLATLEKLNFEGKEISVADYILSRYESTESLLKPTLSHAGISQIKFENKLVDRNSEEGEAAYVKLSEIEMERLAGEDKDCKNPYEKYEAAQKIVDKKFVIEQQ